MQNQSCVDTLDTAANAVLMEMQSGHSELTYNNAIKTQLSKQNICCRTEVCCPFLFQGVCVGYGKADIVFENLIVELKVGTSLYAKEAKTQLVRYIEALNTLENKNYIGAVLYIDKCNASYRIISVDVHGNTLYDTAISDDKMLEDDANAILMDLFKSKYKIVKDGSHKQGIPLSRITALLTKQYREHKVKTHQKVRTQDITRDIKHFIKLYFTCNVQSRRNKRLTMCYPRHGTGIGLAK